jgi:hypothetical protein
MPALDNAREVFYHPAHVQGLVPTAPTPHALKLSA